MVDAFGLIPPAAFDELLVAVLERDPDAVAGWLEEHVETSRSAGQLIDTLARCASVLVRVAAGAPAYGDPADDETWLIAADDDEGMTGTDPGRQSVRLVVAAMNEDDAGIRGMTVAALDRDEEYVAVLIAKLLGILADAGAACEAREAEGE